MLTQRNGFACLNIPSSSIVHRHPYWLPPLPAEVISRQQQSPWASHPIILQPSSATPKPMSTNLLRWRREVSQTYAGSPTTFSISWTSCSAIMYYSRPPVRIKINLRNSRKVTKPGNAGNISWGGSLTPQTSPSFYPPCSCTRYVWT